jgi:hypothetical protein
MRSSKVQVRVGRGNGVHVPNLGYPDLGATLGRSPAGTQARATPTCRWALSLMEGPGAGQARSACTLPVIDLTDPDHPTISNRNGDLLN